MILLVEKLMMSASCLRHSFLMREIIGSSLDPIESDNGSPPLQLFSNGAVLPERKDELRKLVTRFKAI